MTSTLINPKNASNNSNIQSRYIGDRESEEERGEGGGREEGNFNLHHQQQHTK